MGDARDRFLSAVTEMSGTADDWCNHDPNCRTAALDALRVHIVTRGASRMDKDAQKDRQAKETMMSEGTFLNECRMPCGIEFMSVLSQAGSKRLVQPPRSPIT